MTHKRITWQDTATKLVEWQEKNEASVRDTAEEFEYSIGLTCQYLTLGYALRVHKELEVEKRITKALDIIKKKNFRRKFD